MLQFKFDIPSIYIDRYFQPSDFVGNSSSKSLIQWVTEWDIELCNWPEAWDRANNSQNNKMHTWNICAVQLANSSILVFPVIIWNISYGFTLLGISCGPLSKKFSNHVPFMVQTWPWHGPSNWFFLGLNQYPHGCFMPNLKFLAAINTDTFNYLTQ